MLRKNEIKIAVLAGDGIGPEIAAATTKVLRAAASAVGLKLSLKSALIGWIRERRHIRAARGLSPGGTGRFEGSLRGLRRAGLRSRLQARQT